MDALELDFMSGLLCMDPARRLTGAQCLAHPYLADLAGTNMGNATTAAMAARARSNCGERTVSSNSTTEEAAEEGASDTAGDDGGGSGSGGVHGWASSSRGSLSTTSPSARKTEGQPEASGGGTAGDEDSGGGLPHLQQLPEAASASAGQQAMALGGEEARVPQQQPQSAVAWPLLQGQGGDSVDLPSAGSRGA